MERVSLKMSMMTTGTSCTLQDSVYVYMYLIEVAVLAHGANSFMFFSFFLYIFSNEIIAWKFFLIYFFVCVCVH